MPSCCMREAALPMECWLCEATMISVLPWQTCRITCSTQLRGGNELEMEAQVKLTSLFDPGVA